MNSTASTSLFGFGVLAARGPDARKFLHGQLSQDVLGLPADRLTLAGLHNAQGRTLALLRLVAQGETDVLAILPRELLTPVVTTLGKFVLRAKLQLRDESALWAIDGVWPATPAAQSEFLWPHATDGRAIRLTPISDASEPIDKAGNAVAYEHWHAADIADGLPTVCAATSGRFVAQMLNLDVLDAIAFTKGCYTGQEVIARAHYRGRVKRRMQRFLAPHGVMLQPGASGALADGRAYEVVDAAMRKDGRCEFLAVANFGAEFPAAPEGLPLPYALPD